MANEAPVRYAASFTMRTDDDFLDALDEVREGEKPVPSRADMLRRLVFEAQRKARARK